MATYIISDIHGCIQTLRMLIEGKLKVSLQDRLFFLGDYIDRGPDSSAVVEYIIGLMRSGYTISCLIGNHEQMMLDSVKGESELCLWQANSGQATIKSYVKMFGFDDDGHLGFLPKAHLDFFT
ncbi:MAG: serine/threonine protein phosphatase [Bacteroidales bacterium]|nr:serine/threonine protein phosphatase [Bacteroidales bacterium]